MACFRSRAFLIWGALAAMISSSCPVGAAERVVVSAAASLRDVLAEIGQAYQLRHGEVELAFNFASSGQLMSQIELGAPVDIFVSADVGDVLRLGRKGLLAAEGTFARNSLIVAVSLNAAPSIREIDDLANKGVRLITTGKQAPLGTYTRDFLHKAEASGLYRPGFEAKVLGNIVSEEQEARTLSAKIGMGEADAAVVYVTDLTNDVKTKTRTISIPADLNVTAEYGVGLVTGSAGSSTSREFYQFLTSGDAATILLKHGFLLP
jgi:molybdate transport system substrate-binding protein